MKNFKKDLQELIKQIIPDIEDDFIENDGDEPHIMLTVGSDGQTWTYQTGDNSYYGGAYHYPHWCIAPVTRDCNPEELAIQIEEELEDLIRERENDL